MKVRSHSLTTSLARGIAVLCAAVFVTSAHTAQAGINVWTSHGPGGSIQVAARSHRSHHTRYTLLRV